MKDVLPRTLVADALGVGEDALPPGDLPLDRLAERFLAYLRAGDADDPAPADHPDAWTYALMDALTRDHPARGFAAVVAAVAACDTPEDVALVAAGPLEDLIVQHGAENVISDEHKEKDYENVVGKKDFQATRGISDPVQHDRWNGKCQASSQIVVSSAHANHGH